MRLNSSLELMMGDHSIFLILNIENVKLTQDGERSPNQNFR